MAGIVHWVQSFALSIGAPGLFLAAFLDSSFLSLPQIIDLLVIVTVAQNKALMPLYALSATLGSIAGCLIPYYAGRKGGEALVHRRFGAARAVRAVALLQRHGMLAVLIPALLPPPAPFKLFVLLAGVAGIPLHSFITAIVIGRGLRYFGEGFLAVRYGDAAMALLEEKGQVVGLVAAALFAGGAAAYVIARRRKAKSR
jgi:membrane protein YqaA with SNARE-associated domain